MIDIIHVQCSNIVMRYIGEEELCDDTIMSSKLFELEDGYKPVHGEEIGNCKFCGYQLSGFLSAVK